MSKHLKFLQNNSYFSINILFILIFATLFLGGNLFSYTPGNGDEGGHMRAAVRAVSGEVIYLGGMYKPTYITAIAAAMIVFGTKVWVGSFISLVFSLLSVYLIYLLTKKLTNSEYVAVASSLLLVVSKLFVFYSKVVRPETMISFAFLFILWMYIFIVEQKKSFKHYLLLGAFIGISFWIRNSAIILLGAIFLGELFLYLTKQTKIKKALKNYVSVLITSGSIIGFGSLIYRFFTPNDEFGNYVEHIAPLDLLVQFFDSVNFFYYPLIMWNELSPLFTVFLGIAAIYVLHYFLKQKTFLQKKYTTEIITMIFVFFTFFFLTIYPQHRFKLFLPFVVLSILLAGWTLNQIKIKKFFFFGIVSCLLFLSLIINSYDLTTYKPQGVEDAYTFLNNQVTDEKIITSNYIMSAYYLPYVFDKSISEKRIKSSNEIRSVEELKELANEGYRYIFVDFKIWEQELKDESLDYTGIGEFLNTEGTPIFKVHNEVWSTDIQISGNYYLYSTMTDLDKKRARYVPILDKDGHVANEIKIYDLYDVFQVTE